MANPSNVQAPVSHLYNTLPGGGATLSYGSATTAGSTLLAAICSASGAHVAFTVTNAAGTQTFTKDADTGYDSSNNACMVYRLDNASSTTGVKIVQVSGNPIVLLGICEVANLNPSGSLDVKAQLFASQTGETVSTAATVNAAEYVLACCMNATSATPPGTATGYTNIGTNTQSLKNAEIDYLITGSAGVQTATWATLGAPTNIVAAIVAYKAPSAFTITHTAGLSLPGTLVKAPSRSIPAALSMAGTRGAAVIGKRLIAAALSLSGTLKRATARTLTAGALRLAGAVATAKNGGAAAYTFLASATLSLVGSVATGLLRKVTLIQSQISASANGNTVIVGLNPTAIGSDIILIAASKSSSTPAETLTSSPAGATPTVDLAWVRPAAGQVPWLKIWRIPASQTSYTSFTLAATLSQFSLWVGEFTPGNLTLLGVPATSGAIASTSRSILYGTSLAGSTSYVELLAASNNNSANPPSVTSSQPTLTLLAVAAGSGNATTLGVFDALNTLNANVPAATIHQTTSAVESLVMVVYTGAGFKYTQSLTAAFSAIGIAIKGTARTLPAGAISLAGSVQHAIESNGLIGSLSAAGATGFATARALTAATLSGLGTIQNETDRAVSGTLSFVGTYGPAITGKMLDAGTTLSGVIGRATVHGLTGVISSSGTAIKNTARALASATLSAAGGIQNGTGKLFTAGSTLAGTVQRQTARTLTAALTLSGSLRRDTTRIVLGALSAAGTLGRATARGFAANLTPSGTLGKATRRALSGIISAAGQMIVGNNFQIALSAALALAGTASRVPGKVFTAVLTTSATIGRGTAHGMAAAAAFGGTVARSTARTFSAAAALGGSLLKGPGKSLVAGLMLTGTRSVSIGKALVAATLTLAGMSQQGIARLLTATTSLTGTVSRATQRGLSGSLALVGSLPKQTALFVSGALTLTGNVGRGVGEGLTASLQASGTFAARLIQKVSFSGSLGLAGLMRRQAGKTLQGAQSSSGQVGRSIGKSLTAALQPVGTVGHGIAHAFAAILTAIGHVTGIRGAAPDYVFHAGILASGWTTGEPATGWTSGQPRSAWATGPLSGGIA